MRNLFYFTEEFRKLHSVCCNVRMRILKDQTKKIERDAYGAFQLYFYENPFGHNVKIISQEILNK